MISLPQFFGFDDTSRERDGYLIGNQNSSTQKEFVPKHWRLKGTLYGFVRRQPHFSG